MKNKDVQRFSPMLKTLHWLVAIIVIVMLSATFFIDELPKELRPVAFMYHKSFGLTVLALMIWRIIWIHSKGRPALPGNMPLWEKLTAHFVQYGLYLLLIIMPLSGWLMSVAADKAPVYFGLFKVPFPGISPNKPLAEFMNETHETLAWVIIAFVVLHIAGALKQHYYDKNEVLKRMLPWGKTKP